MTASSGSSSDCPPRPARPSSGSPLGEARRLSVRRGSNRHHLASLLRGVLVCTSPGASKSAPGRVGARKQPRGSPHRPASMSNERPAVYECDGCGACCGAYTDLRVAPRTPAASPGSPARLRSSPPGSRPRGGPIASIPCPSTSRAASSTHDTRCTIYETRPEVCREFAAGDQPCQHARAMRDLPPLDPIEARPIRRVARQPRGERRACSATDV